MPITSEEIARWNTVRPAPVVKRLTSAPPISRKRVSSSLACASNILGDNFSSPFKPIVSKRSVSS